MAPIMAFLTGTTREQHQRHTHPSGAPSARRRADTRSGRVAPSSAPPFRRGIGSSVGRGALLPGICASGRRASYKQMCNISVWIYNMIYVFVLITDDNIEHFTLDYMSKQS